VFGILYELEKLVSNCSVVDSETSSMHEAETIFVTPKPRSDDQTVVTVGTKNGNQNAYHDERHHCLENMKYFSKENNIMIPCRTRKNLQNV